jgi:hypothetical protein
LDTNAHGGDYEESDILICNAVQFGETPTFRRNMPPPYSGPKDKSRKKSVETGGKMKMEAICFSEMPGFFSELHGDKTQKTASFRGGV